MSPRHGEAALYAASVNPSRHAKRSRPSFSAAATPAPGSFTDAANDRLSRQSAPPSALKKRGRRPKDSVSTVLTRAARESARRTNHSRIEKARRLKINRTLEVLRELTSSEPAVGDYRDRAQAGGSAVVNADSKDVVQTGKCIEGCVA